ncbi:AraC-like DNA-binding protein [Sphingobacterium yanglingense]|uniref:AraC-like DNA-binding protein n=1 Tax=Sphingobacterium yanglingense TaxID=1437280 RepID=A0A4R6WG75_9SPHI|nr:AraC-like DNA-binding protein [Sphingobacterium yanglingense]
MERYYKWNVRTDIAWHKTDDVAPSYPIKNAACLALQSELGSIIEQTFDGRYVYLYYYEIEALSPFTIQIKSSKGDCHLLYHLTEIPLQLIMVNKPDSEGIRFEGQAQIDYISKGKYYIDFPPGRHIITGLVFDIGIIRPPDTRSYAFILPVQEAWRNKARAPLCGPAFRIGPLTRKALCTLFGRLVAKLETEYILVRFITYLIKLSRMKLLQQEVHTPEQKIRFARQLMKVQISQVGAKAQIGEVASSMGEHPDALGRLHQRYYGHSFLQYRNDVLLKYVIYAIKEHDKLLEAALEAGFAGLSELTKFVKTQTGKAPGYFK